MLGALADELFHGAFGAASPRALFFGYYGMVPRASPWAILFLSLREGWARMRYFVAEPIVGARTRGRGRPHYSRSRDRRYWLPFDPSRCV